MTVIGYVDGDVCLRRGCQGIIDIYPIQDCSCHINPPCGACTRPQAHCATCGWQQKDDFIINDYVVNFDPQTGHYHMSTLRPLSKSKIDWHSKPHSNSSMIKEGVYPEGTSQTDLEKVVTGTFGGRFEYFANGKFKYIAYTD